MKEENISALVDGELESDDVTAAIDALAGDPDLRRAWGRYHMIGEVLRSGDESAAVSRPRAAASGVVPLATPPERFRPVVGLAIAASVAALALALVLLPASDSGDAAFDVAASGEVVEAIAPQVASIQVPLSVGVTPVGANDRRLNGYLVNFNEQRARLGVPGVHPYVRIVGFEAE